MNNQNIDRELSWDSEITKDSSGFVLLEAGEYDFTVKSFTRARHGGSAKLPSCPKAILKLGIIDPATGEELTQLEHNLFLHSKVEGLLSAFFVSVGMKKHGESTKINFEGSIGKKGRCKIKIEEWTKDNGEKAQNNRIDRFLEPEEKEPEAPPFGGSW